MDAVGGARGYGAFTGPVSGDGSASILRKASDAAKSETARTESGGVAEGRSATVRPDAQVRDVPPPGSFDVTDADASAEASAETRPIGNLGQHLDLRL